jgi:MtaA/CmuA family methyltransferase
MMDFYDDPGFVDDLLDFAVEMELAFARAQVDRGVNIVGVGDAAASLIGPVLYEKHVWPRQRRLVEGLHAMGTRVRLHICGNTRPLVTLMGQLGCDIVDLDSLTPLAEARAAMGPEQVLCGNLDPVRALRNASAEAVRAGLAACHREAGPRYIVAAGCEVPRGTPDANLRALTDFTRLTAPGGPA